MNRTDELSAKLERVRKWLSATGSGSLLLRQRPSFAWITCGGHSHVNTATEAGLATVIITHDRLALIASNIEIARLAAEQVAGLPFELANYPWNEPARRDRVIQDIAGRAIAIADVPGYYGLIPDDTLKAMRASLLPSEVERLRQVGKLATQIVETACRQLAPGWTEHQAAAEVIRAAAAAGARVPVCLVAGDDRIARYRHPMPTDAPIRERAMIVACVEKFGLIASITRLVNFAPPDEDLLRRQRAICAVDAAAVTGTTEGRQMREIFADIVAAYAAHGFPHEWLQHHQGGPTGYQAREMIVSSVTDARVQMNQPFAWNPSVAGAKSEDTILATSQGWEWITAPGPDWPAVEVTCAGQCLKRAGILVRA